LTGIAFLGCGFATRIHTKRLRGMEGVSLFYASRSLAKAEEFSRKAGGAGAFGSYEAAIADPRVEVIVVATPPTTHLELTLAALAAGKHVVVEKPPFLHASDFDAVRAARDAAGRRVMVAENYFYKPMAEALRTVIANGDIGEPRLLTINALKAQATENWRDDPSLAGGGALFEGGIHWINFMANLGLPVRRATGYRPGGRPGEPDRTTLAVFEYEGGAVGTLAYSWEIGSPLKGLRLSALYGTEGAATFETNGIFLAVRGRRRRVAMPGVADIPGYAAMWRDFLPALRENREPRFTFEAARRDMDLLEAVYASMDR
jgi:predicted dehydrogenase